MVSDENHDHDRGGADHGGAGHSHAAGANRTRLAIAFGITVTILIAEVIGSIITGSLALLVDATHMLTDAGGLLMALIAAGLMGRPSTSKRTWGYRRAEILAATAQAAILLAVGIYVLVEGIQRLFAPPEIASTELLVFGIIGLVGNVVALLVLTGGRRSNLNMRAAFLEVTVDALGSVGVIAAAIVIALTGWTQADAIAALVIGLLILPRSLMLLRETVDVLLESTPRGLDLDAVRTHILDVPHVVAVHDLHATQIATGLPVLTAHVVIEDECFTDGHAATLVGDLQQCVAEHFDISIEHSTFQLEAQGHVERRGAVHD